MKLKTPTLGLLLLLAGWPDLVSAYYDPGVQRWINRDPLGDQVTASRLSGGRVLTGALAAGFGDYSPHAFGFCNSNPLSNVDPDGRSVLAGVPGGLGFLLGGYGIVCDGIITYQMFRARAELENGVCLTWYPRCLNLIAIMTNLSGPLGVQFCKDCDDKFNATVVVPPIIGGGPPPMT